MTRITRREAIQGLGLAGAALVLRIDVDAQGQPLTIAGMPAELRISSISPVTIRMSVVPRTQDVDINHDRALVPLREQRHTAGSGPVKFGDLTLTVSSSPLTLKVSRGATLIQELSLDETGAFEFLIGDAPVLGFGEGGIQFDRRGVTDVMRNGQGGYQLQTHGGRVPIQWLIGTGGWALFIHQPYGAFDLKGPKGKMAVQAQGRRPAPPALPFDAFLIVSKDPAVIMREYARITGLPEMPPLWSFGYQQSHRTLAGPDEIKWVADTMRAKKLPCDALIYLGTDFCPSGWNTHNGEFEWNKNNFPDPKKAIDDLHAQHYKVVLHTVIEGFHLTGTVKDTCTTPERSGRTPDANGDVTKGTWPDERSVGCYWPSHKGVYDLGIDGWWPDQGDGLDGPSRLNRIRMYWEGSQLWRPDERPYALHRNGYPGMARYGAFLWSGDVYSRWETLKTHVPVAVNTALSGIPYWGTDIGGFVPTADFLGELYVRWFQFGAFCTLFRSHGRTWHLRLPWGWNLGEIGPEETNTYRGAGRPPDSELHNAQVEPICRQYLELRYRLMPYLYSAVREASQTGMPILRAMWIHYPDDPAAVSRGDQYLWGRDMLVAPVVEQGAKSRRLYLPKGAWFDFWTEKTTDGGREIDRDVDLATTPLYVRAGAIIPMDPVRQYVGEKVDGPLTVTVYPGADGSFDLFEDDGRSFEFRRGGWMGISFAWNDAQRRLTVTLTPGSRMRPPLVRDLAIRVAGQEKSTPVKFSGKRLVISI
jgi:alpha-glucosidase (family GH31 glycosyl hydrolase)